MLDGTIESAARLSGPITGNSVSIDFHPGKDVRKALDDASNLSSTLRAGELKGTWTAVSVKPLQRSVPSRKD